MRRAIGVFAVAASVPVLAGCPSNPCQGPSVTVDDRDAGVVTEGVGPDDGVMWQSGPLYGPWLAYNGGETLTFKYPSGFHPSQPPFVWVSTGAYQGPDAGATFTGGSGQLDEYTSFDEGGVSVTNQSCANYYVFVSVQGRLVDGGAAPPADASAPSDASKD